MVNKLNNYSFSSSKVFLHITLFIVTAYVLLLLITYNNEYWYYFLLVLAVVQIRFKNDVSSLFPIIAVLTLTEYYFILGEKRIYFCEMLFMPLLVNYFFINFKKHRIKLVQKIVILLFLLIITFQGFNFLIYSDFSASSYRIRSVALPLLLIIIINNLIKNKSDLKKIINIILIVSLLATLIVYLQYITGKFYVLQTEKFYDTEDINFINGYLTSTEDTFLFNLIGLNVKGPMPPVGLNFYKSGYSETIIVSFSLFFALYVFRKSASRIYCLIFSILIFFGTLLTGSRTILLTFLFTMIILYLFHKNKLRWKLIVGIIFSIFIVTYFITPLLSLINLEEFGNLASRIFYLDDFFKYIVKYPSVLLFGSSPEIFLKLTGAGQPPHHFFAFGIIYDGLIITFALFISIYLLLKKILYFKSEDSEILAIGYGLWTSLFVYIFIYGQTSYLTWSTPHNMFFCIIIGLLISTYRISKVQVKHS